MKVTKQVFELPCHQIFLDSDFNCREFINPMECDSLARDIKANGLSQPITVQPYDKAPYKYRILMGHRRFTAVSKLNKSETIEALIEEKELDPTQALIMNVNENLQRQELTLAEEAKIVGRLRETMSRTEVAEILKMSTGWVQTRKQFYDLPPAVQTEFIQHNLKTSEVRKVYQIYNDSFNGDYHKMYAYVRALKDGKANPESVLKAKKPKRRNEKRVRQRPELEALMCHIRESGRGACIATRILAWACGNITSGELDLDLKRWHDEEGFEYASLFDDGSDDYGDS